VVVLPAVPAVAVPPAVAPAWPGVEPPVELPDVPPLEIPAVPPVELPVVPPVGLPVAPPFGPADVPAVGLPVVPPSLPVPPAPGVPLPSVAHAGIKKARQIPEIDRCVRIMVNMIAIARCSSDLSFRLTKTTARGRSPHAGPAPGNRSRAASGAEAGNHEGPSADFSRSRPINPGSAPFRAARANARSVPRRGPVTFLPHRGSRCVADRAFGDGEAHELSSSRSLLGRCRVRASLASESIQRGRAARVGDGDVMPEPGAVQSRFHRGPPSR
jgi:hypothetical protein